MSGLNSYVIAKQHAIRARHMAISAAESYTPVQIVAHAEAAGRSGVRRIRIRDFQICSDSPPEFAGHDLGPTSPELLLGVLASCIVHTYIMQAATLNMGLDGVIVEVTADIDLRAGHPDHQDVPAAPTNIRYTAHVASGDADLEELNDNVRRACPVMNLLEQKNTIVGEVRPL